MRSLMLYLHSTHYSGVIFPRFSVDWQDFVSKSLLNKNIWIVHFWYSKFEKANGKTFAYFMESKKKQTKINY